MESLSSASALPLNLFGTVSAPSKTALKDAQVTKASQEFESMFLNQMLQEMFTGLGEDALTGDPSSDEIYRSMLVQQYGDMISKSGGIGIADYVKRELLKTQEVGV